jgi:hypothetical protein
MQQCSNAVVERCGSCALPILHPSALLRPISIAHLGKSLLVANGDSLVNDHKSNEGLHPRYPRKKGRATHGKRVRLSSIPGSFFKPRITTHLEPWERELDFSHGQKGRDANR